MGMARRGLIGLLFVLLPGAVLAPTWRLGGLEVGEDDILYYFPSRTLLAEFAAEGQWPWLSPWTGLDRPYLADPQSAVFYPATWLFALLEPRTAYPLHLWLHFSLAMWGAYRLARAQGLSPAGGVVAGVVFGLGGFMLAHRGHFAMQAAAAWVPWVFWRFERLVVGGVRADHRLETRATTAHGLETRATADHGLETRATGGLVRLTAAAVVGGLQCYAGHVQIAALTALGLAVYLPLRARAWREPLTAWLAGWLAAGGIFAAQALPTLAYLRETTRVERGFADFVENSWSPVSAVGVLLPFFLGQRTTNFFGQAWWGPSHQLEQFFYVGIVPLVLAAAVVAAWRFDRRRTAWAGLLLFAVLLALGQFGPVCPLLYWLPGASLFRVPARAMVLAQLALALLAAMGADGLASRLTPERARLRAMMLRIVGAWKVWAGLVLAGPVMALAAMPLLAPATREAAWRAVMPWNPAIWVALLVIIASLAALHLALRRFERPAWLLLPAAVLLADLGIIGWSVLVPRGVSSADELLASADRDAWRPHVEKRPGRLWTITPRPTPQHTPGEYIDPLGKGVANTNILAGVESLTDYGPLQPAAVVRRFGFNPWGEAPRAAEILEERFWRVPYNVAWLLLCQAELPVPEGCEVVEVTPSGYRLVFDPDARGMAFLEDATEAGVVAYEPRGPSSFVTRYAPAVTEMDGAGAEAAAFVRVVVSRLALPGWRAWVNGQRWPVEATEEGLLSVRVPRAAALRAGFDVEWRYFPPGLVGGSVTSGLSAGVLLGAVLWSRIAVR